jgi:DNA-binding MarR family transcriptional regulator
MEAVAISQHAAVRAAEPAADTEPAADAAAAHDAAAPHEADEFLTGFDTLAQAVRRARGTTHQDSDGALTLSQYAILQALTERQHARVRDLATEAGIAPSTATRILDALERRAIVTRRRTPEDRRGVTVRLTDRGRDALSAQDAWMRARQRAFFAALPPHERELAPDLLVRLAALIDELAAGPQR